MCEKTWLYFMHCHCLRGQFPWESNALLMITILLQVWSIYNLVMKKLYLFARRNIIRSPFCFFVMWVCLECISRKLDKVQMYWKYDVWCFSGTLNIICKTIFDSICKGMVQFQRMNNSWMLKKVIADKK